MTPAASEPVPDPMLGPVLGVTEQFPFGKHRQVRQTIAALRAFGLTSLRTRVSWNDYHAEGGETWFAWLLPELANSLDLSLRLDAPADRLAQLTALVLSRRDGHPRRLEFDVRPRPTAGPVLATPWRRHARRAWRRCSRQRLATTCSIGLAAAAS